MSQERVVVAMSGGVDSSVAAALLVEQRYDVVGIMLRLWSEADNGSSPANRCCALDAQYDAERVAEKLGIPFYVVNVASQFKQHVVEYFEKEYAAGRTPNPCIECNRKIRFGALLHRTLALEATFLSTGHYARIRRLRDGSYQLLRGIDGRKDQSYVLHMLGQAQLAHVLLPIGSMSKPAVRKVAQDRGLPVADRKDSQDLCFVTDGDYRRYLAERMPKKVRPGAIRDSAGHMLGTHSGLAHFTVGQRKGLAVSGTEPLYVLALDPIENTVIVGTAGELGRHSCTAQRVTWINGDPPGQSFDGSAKIRYRAHDAPVEVTVLDHQTARVRFRQAQRDITPGQAIVFYRDEVVLGGGTIALSDAPTAGSGQKMR